VPPFQLLRVRQAVIAQHQNMMANAAVATAAATSLATLPPTLRPPSLAIGTAGLEPNLSMGAQPSMPSMTPASSFLHRYEHETLHQGHNGAGVLSPRSGLAQAPNPAPSRTEAHQAAVKRAVVEVKQSLATENPQQVPLDMLPYFRFLNEDGKRSMLRQLILKYKNGHAKTPSGRAFATATNGRATHLNGDGAASASSAHGSRELEGMVELVDDKLFNEPLLTDQELRELWSASPRMMFSPTSSPAVLRRKGDASYEAAVAAAAVAVGQPPSQSPQAGDAREDDWCLPVFEITPTHLDALEDSSP